ncbi:signal peptide peptidase SppA [Natranaerofaba carboxydovora]|uniref:signal peptide peptidase SppA n=1 Tax=Natranaerofaba carboxydovora TaxID=2742683 RepID=UPI001F13FBAE|nr:signal peptide peptidase SppA [Natranaerofaba carboxydovora]UMZ74188.1 Putative signal peptide peptidase SppA [Natranaerofaba carboxydovora]
MFVKDDLKDLIMFALKSIIVFVLVLSIPLVMLLMVGAFSIALTGTDVAEEEGTVYVVDLQGAIQEGPVDFMNTGINPNLVDSRLSEIENRGAEAVVLRVNSPGGSVAASQEIASIIDNYELPVVISMADTAASGGYYISSPADHIMANAGTTTGSIGVISVIMNLEGLYEKLGIEVEVITSGEFKGMGHESLTDEEKQKIQDMSDDFYEQFVGDISDYRGIDKDEVYEVATGEVFTGRKAYELGLVDSLGGMNEAVDKAGELAGIDDPRKARLESPSLAQQLFNIVSDLPSIIENYRTPEKLQYFDEFDDNFPVRFKYKQ